MPDPDILLAEDGPLLEVTFNRPTKYNAMNAAIFEGLQEAVDRMRRKADLRVLLIRAAGKYFSSGFDITALEGARDGEGAAEFRVRYRGSARHDLWDDLEALEKPVVVAHHGVCLGAGLEMSLSCDFRLASDAAAYGLPEMDMGMIPGSGGTSRLVRLVGPHWARWLVMASERVDSAQALDMGLVHAVWPAKDFEARTRAFCDKLARQPPEALAAAKLAIELTNDLERAQARNVERLVNSSLSGREEQARVFAALQARLAKPKA